MQWQCCIFPSELTVSGINSGRTGSKNHSKHGSKEKNHITNTLYFQKHKFSSSVTVLFNTFPNLNDMTCVILQKFTIISILNLSCLAFKFQCSPSQQDYFRF